MIVGHSTAGTIWPWERLKYGMSVEEVQRLIPGAGQIAGSHLYNGAKESLTRKGITVAAIACEASYFFKDGKFIQVNVLDPAMNKNDVTLSNFKRLMSELRGRFGSEENREVKKERWGISGRASWSVGSDKLWVSISPVTADTAQLTFGYTFAR